MARYEQGRSFAGASHFVTHCYVQGNEGEG
jgi:hypothetical protein